MSYFHASRQLVHEGTSLKVNACNMVSLVLDSTREQTNFNFSFDFT